MSTIISSATATCTIPAGTPAPEDVAVAICDFVANHEDVELPDDLEDLDSDDFVHEIVPYLSIANGTELTISYDNEDDKAYSSSIFDFLVDHFKTLQTSDVMEVQWSVYDSRDGQSSGANYYRKDGTKVDVVADSAALDKIANLLSGKEWNVDTLMSISDIIESTGREIKDVN